MKKLIIILMVIAMALAGTFTFAACNKPQGDVVKVIEVPLTVEKYAFAVNKADSALLESVNAFIATIKSNGQMDAIIDKYFGEGTIEGITSATFDSAKQQLVVATNAQFPPFEYTIGNKFAGIDMEIAALIAAHLNLELVISDMEFDSVITSVNSNLADIAMAALTVTPAREESVNFTSTYFNASQMIIAKADDTTFDGLATAEEIEAKLASLSGKKVGVQAGTTGKYYTAGSEDWGYDGYSNITVKEYTTGALAVQDLINGQVDYVIIDEMPAKLISKSFNKK